MMLRIGDNKGEFGVKQHTKERMINLNPRRCIGKYDKQIGMKKSMRGESRRCFRGFSSTFKPWKKRWHFFSYKHDGRWCRGESGEDFTKRSVLFRNGRELIRLDLRTIGRRCLIARPAYFHPEKHRVDFCIWVNEYHEENKLEFEIGINCELDGRHSVDTVSSSWVTCKQNLHGRWSCDGCMETGDPNAESGYIKPTFDSKQSLLLDHMKPTLDGIRFLCSHDKVGVWLSSPNDPRNSSSCVRLTNESKKVENWFWIHIGIVNVSPLENGASEEAQWIHERLSKEIADGKKRR